MPVGGQWRQVCELGFHIAILIPPAYDGEPYVLGQLDRVSTIIYESCGGMLKGLQCAWVKFWAYFLEVRIFKEKY